MNISRYMDCVRWLAFLCFLATGTATMAGEKITYHHFDALGSPVAATNEQGIVIWRETYQPYGERIQKSPAAATNTRWHTGHVLDPETGLQYAGARYYDPVIGRFMGIDPQDYKEGELHTYNRYAYGANNPYKYVDPDGRAIQFLFWVFAGGATYHEMSKPVTLDEYGDAALVSIPYPMGPLGGIGPGTKAGKSLLSSPHINPKDIAGKTPSQIDKLAKDKGLISKGSNPKSGKGAYIDPATGKQRVLCHTNCADPHAHVNNPQGKRLDINGKVVPPESPAAHLPINYP